MILRALFISCIVLNQTYEADARKERQEYAQMRTRTSEQEGSGLRFSALGKKADQLVVCCFGDRWSKEDVDSYLSPRSNTPDDLRRYRFKTITFCYILDKKVGKPTHYATFKVK